MSAQLPSLGPDGAVMFAAPADFEASWTTSLARGALIVRNGRELAPLEQLQVRLVVPGAPEPIPLRVEVVSLQTDRAMLRLLDPLPAKPALLTPEPASASAAPMPAPAPAPSTPPVDSPVAIPLAPFAAPPDIAPLAPPPVLTAPVLTAPVLTAPVPNAQLAPPPIVAPTPASSPPPVALSAASLVSPLQAGWSTLGERKPAASSASGPELVPLLALEPLAAPMPPAVYGAPEPPPIQLEPLPAAAPGGTSAVHAPSAPSDAAVAAPAPAPAPVGPAPAPATAPVAAGTAPAPPVAAAPAALPPAFTGDSLRFESAEHLKASREHLEGVGAVLAVADGKLPLVAVDIRLVVGTRETRGRTRVMLSAVGPGTAVVQAVERGGFKHLLVELDGSGTNAWVFNAAPIAGTAPNTVASPTDSGPAPQRSFTMARSGDLANPRTPLEILALPLARAPSDDDLAVPSVALLLRWLRTQRGVLRLEVTAADQPVHTVVIVDGREVRSPASLATLGKALALPKMSYTVVDIGRPPQMTTSGRTLHLIAEVVRGLCSQCSVEDLAASFPRREGKYPRAVVDVVAGLGLPAQHQRFVRTDVNGMEPLEKVARAAVGGRTVWETLYLLELYQGLSWDEPPAPKAGSSRTSQYERPGTGTWNAPNQDEVLWAKFDGKDHFHILGLHWSASPADVAPAYAQLRSEYGQGGLKRPENNELAEKILKRLEEAFKVLSDTNQRRAYRREKFNMVWSHQAHLLVQKAKLALYRKDYPEAQNILLAAEDMCSTDEAKALLGALKKKTSGR